MVSQRLAAQESRWDRARNQPVSAEPGDDPTQLSQEELDQIQTAERFFKILETNPRRGTTLDRVYGHHIEFGTLDPFFNR